MTNGHAASVAVHRLTADRLTCGGLRGRRGGHTTRRPAVPSQDRRQRTLASTAASGLHNETVLQTIGLARKQTLNGGRDA
jgi:hypothetical protein